MVHPELERETTAPQVRIIADIVPTLQGLSSLLDRFGLTLEIGDTTGPIPGSYWGDVEAGLIGDRLHASALTPLHSVLHEACHWICLDAPRRCHLHTDAGGDDAEENAVCYLQVLLADWVPGLGRTRLFADMDAWGYHFRLGSARAWFEDDAEDARAWLVRHGIIMPNGHPTWHVRDDPRALVTKTVAGVQP